MIDEISNKITNVLKRHDDNISDEKAEVVAYGMNILIYQVLITLIIFLMSIVFGILGYTAIAFFVFVFLRVTAGGSHARNRVECAIMNFSALFGSVLIAKYLWSDSYIPAIAVFLFNMAIILRYAPGDTVERPIISIKLRRKQKILASVIMTALFAIALVSWSYDRVIYNTIVISSLLTMLLLTPLGYRVFRCKRSCEETADL